MAHIVAEKGTTQPARTDRRKLYALAIEPGEYTLDGQRVRLTAGHLMALAHTKSEARSELKRRLGLKRLDVGANVFEVPKGTKPQSVDILVASKRSRHDPTAEAGGLQAASAGF